ncbi:hypothetical protein ACFVYA_30290 [Amycolatopsis sp. NPDC058278]|uniref:hypothetical protein n=1 Tax=Amycolatopsis sp. NPDC058278 TaxID=3346417 RepID=UPI0036D8E235
MRDVAEHTEALTRLLEQGRRERCAAMLSEAEAYAAAEPLGQFAQLDPPAALNQLASAFTAVSALTPDGQPLCHAWICDPVLLGTALGAALR